MASVPKAVHILVTIRWVPSCYGDRNFPQLLFNYIKISANPFTMACSKMSVEQQILLDNRDVIINTLDTDDIIDQLKKERLISQSTVQRLIGRSKIDKNRIVFEQLSNAGPGMVEKFCNILKNQLQRRRPDKSKELEERT